MTDELREALTAAGASALVPTIVDPQILEYQRRYSPLVRMIPSKKWDSDTYYFNSRTVNPAGGFVTDGGTRPVSSSTYVRNSFQMKHLETVGSVTGYAQAVTRQLVGDLYAAEVAASIKGLYWDLEVACLWGNSGSTQYGAYPQFDGLDSLVNSYSGSNQNVIDGSGSTISLAMLDELADMVETNAAMSVFDSNWMFVMSNTAVSKIAQLQQSNQRFVDTTEAAVGLIVPTYRNIPLVKSSFLSTRNTSMGTVTTATATTGGNLPTASTYKYVVTAVVARQGETAPCAEVSQTTGGTGTNTITLSFSTLSGYEAAQPQLYKVYRTAAGGGTGTETLLGVVDATVGLAADGVTPILTTSIVDDGVTLTPKNGSTAPAQVPATYQNGSTAIKPPALGYENIYLVPRDPEIMVRPYVRELAPLDVYPTTASPDQRPYAAITDTTLALRAPRYVGRLSRAAVAV